MELIAGRVTDIFTTVSTEEAADAARLHIARATRSPSAMAATRPSSAPTPPRARASAPSSGWPRTRWWSPHLSRLVRHKGYPELLAAMAQLPADMPAHLVVVGTRLASDHGPDMAPYFAASGLGARLQRLGYRTDVAAVLAASDIFVLPSHFEGLPMSVIEAMLCALPVVATDIRVARGSRSSPEKPACWFRPLPPLHRSPPPSRAWRGDAPRRARAWVPPAWRGRGRSTTR